MSGQETLQSFIRGRQHYLCARRLLLAYLKRTLGKTAYRDSQCLLTKKSFRGGVYSAELITRGAPDEEMNGAQRVQNPLRHLGHVTHVGNAAGEVRIHYCYRRRLNF